ncbi:uncharacterized protein FFB20_07566 [Fusarium fujikuroi]|nr:uncharacterized protein FFB20_07566 [Fusarium fujikuroi]SCO33487.1 uncharacterized protein FFMR_03113 [Fusarium fujikuroi]SCO48224.1 uncharacterized protein FFNC_12013 [Fusarium fujikuroi]SCV26157.1 uncharacterized protein FFB14_00925 [Fusarium fujikuroi]SCV30936.1 uncharacterized protein FFFS_02602 [Fusarium fujikuroi]
MQGYRGYQLVRRQLTYEPSPNPPARHLCFQSLTVNDKGYGSSSAMRGADKVA